jgi:hypothetical protein
VSARVFRLPDNVSWKKMDDLVIVVDLETGAYYSLNQTASAIWEQIIAGQSLEEVKETLTEVFEVAEERLRTDIAGCIEEWVANRLIVQR